MPQLYIKPFLFPLPVQIILRVEVLRAAIVLLFGIFLGFLRPQSVQLLGSLLDEGEQLVLVLAQPADLFVVLFDLLVLDLAEVLAGKLAVVHPHKELELLQAFHEPFPLVAEVAQTDVQVLGLLGAVLHLGFDGVG